MSASRPVALLVMMALMAGLSGAALLGVSENASAYAPIEITLDVPSFAGTSESVRCVLTISGGPAVQYGTNYTYKAEIIADNKTGSSVGPSTGSSATGKFNVTVVMPGEAQDIKVRINATSKAPDSDESVYKVKEFSVKVVSPIMITATVYNTGDVDAEGVTAEFYADGILLGERVFDVAAGESKELVYNWTWANVAEGEHVVTVVIDDDDDIVEFSDGNNVYSMTVYVGSQSNPIGAILTVGVVIMSVLVALMVMAKPQKKK